MVGSRQHPDRATSAPTRTSADGAAGCRSTQYPLGTLGAWCHIRAWRQRDERNPAPPKTPQGKPPDRAHKGMASWWKPQD